MELITDLEGIQLYFAYGSNLNHKQIRKRCCDVFIETVAYYPNFKLDFTRQSKKGGWVADMIFSPGDCVWGVVYGLDPDGLLALDKSEVVHLVDGYLRQKIVVFSPHGKEYVVWAYFVKIKKGSGQPRLSYMNRILWGARQCDLPVDYRNFLKSIKTQEV